MDRVADGPGSAEPPAGCDGPRGSAADLDIVRFVLVEPQYAGNVGSAARALANLGYRRLELVRAACDPLDREARAMAAGGVDVLEAAGRHDDLDAALAGASTVIGTSRRSGKHRRPHFRLDRLAGDLGHAGPLAVLFGREDHGLPDADLDRCTHLVYLPGAPACPSFNLAQSVLLVAYELCRVGLGTPDEPEVEPPAPHEEREGLYRHLEQALRTIGFLTPQTSEVLMRRLRRLFGRAATSVDEVRLLRGVARQTIWTARRAGLPVAEGPEPADEPRSDER